jgi:hypothetical protein
MKAPLALPLQHVPRMTRPAAKRRTVWFMEALPKQVCIWDAMTAAKAATIAEITVENELIGTVAESVALNPGLH